MDRRDWIFSGWGRGGIIAVVVFTLWTMACAVTGEVKEEIRTLGNLELSHTNVVEHVGDGGPDIVVKVISGSTEGVLKEDGLRLLFRGRGMEQFATTYMGKAGTPSVFQASIPHHERGAWVDYKIEVHGIGGELLTFPGIAGEGIYYSVRFKGSVPKFWLVLHIVTMFLGLLLFLVAAYLSWKYLKARGGYEGIEKISLWGLALLFIGGFPLGFLMGYYTFGKPWTGFPLGGDVTDTKTLIVFVYWLIAIFFRARSSEDETKQRRYARLVIWGAALAAFIYLIPHSI
jgi:hypothetical protein